MPICERNNGSGWRCKHPAKEGGKYCLYHADKACQSVKRRNSLVISKIYDLLGRSCACCGMEGALFLSIDHIASNGAEHKRSLGLRTGNARYYRTILAEIQAGSQNYQILCMSCNVAKHRNGGVCPHQEAQAEVKKPLRLVPKPAGLVPKKSKKVSTSLVLPGQLPLLPELVEPVLEPENNTLRRAA